MSREHNNRIPRLCRMNAEEFAEATAKSPRHSPSPSPRRTPGSPKVVSSPRTSSLKAHSRTICSSSMSTSPRPDSTSSRSTTRTKSKGSKVQESSIADEPVVALSRPAPQKGHKLEQQEEKVVAASEKPPQEQEQQQPDKGAMQPPPAQPLQATPQRQAKATSSATKERQDSWSSAEEGEGPFAGQPAAQPAPEPAAKPAAESAAQLQPNEPPIPSQQSSTTTTSSKDMKAENIETAQLPVKQVEKPSTLESQPHSPTHGARANGQVAPPTVTAAEKQIAEEAAATVAATAAAAAATKPLPQFLLPAVGTSPALTQKHLDVLSAWYTKFCAETEAQQQAAIQQHCAPDVIFEDNFIHVTGQEMMGVQFYALKRSCHGIDLLPEKIEVIKEPGSLTYQLRIISRITFHIWSLKSHPVLSMMSMGLLALLPRSIECWATDTLTVRESDSLILSYQQRVHNIPTGPWPLRWMLGRLLSYFLLSIFGW